MGSQNRKLNVRSTLRFSFQCGHQPLQSQCPLQQGARRDTPPKAGSNWGFLWYFSFFFFLTMTLITLLPKHPKLCVRGHLSVKILGKKKENQFCFGEITSWKVKFASFLNFTERNFWIPWLEALKPTNCHGYHSFPGDATGKLSFEECRVKS